MKHIVLFLGMAVSLMASCSVQEKEFQITIPEDTVFFASFEQPTDIDTKVYVNEDLLLRWTADDRVSIFNKNTYNQQYAFTGETGANSGGFKKVDTDEFTTGNAISHVVSVYPYLESTEVSENETLTINLPAEQSYAENTFGMGANTMVSVSSDNFLQYKNVGGYLMLKLYGDGVSVSSITLKGNNEEKLAGKASVMMPLDGVPSVAMASDAITEITLKCDTPVMLGSTAEESTQFWFVVPPVTFSKGFTITINESTGSVFEKSTSKSITIERNKLSKMTPIETSSDQPNNVIYYTSSDGNVVNPYNSEAFGVKLISNEYSAEVGRMVFDGDVTIIGNSAFSYCSKLKTIEIPSSVNTIDHYAFQNCTALTTAILPDQLKRIGQRAFSSCTELSSIFLPEGLITIGDSAFSDCSSLSTVTIPNSITEIPGYLFYGCTSLTTIRIPDGVTNIWDSAFRNCNNLTSIVLPQGLIEISNFTFSNCSSLTDIIIPNGVTRIGSDAFSGCTALSGNLTIPSGVSTIGATAFMNCTGLNSITLLPTIPPTIGMNVFWNFTGSILVPAESLLAYQNAPGWSTYSYRIAEMGTSYIYYTSADGSIISLNNEYVFGGCRIISNIYTDSSGVITLAGSLTNLDSMAFLGQTNLTSISIPESVTNIGAYAFYDCSNLVRIDVKPVIPPAGGEQMFTHTGSCLIYIPSGSEEAYANADYWADYALRMRVEGSDSSLAYSSSDYSQDGKVIQLQQSTVGRGINIIFMGDGFLDKDMDYGGKYEQRMKDAMEQFFVYEPYRSFRDRFNVYSVKVVSKNNIYGDENSDRRLTYEDGNSIFFRTNVSLEYGRNVPNPFNQPLKICTVCNTRVSVGRSFCNMSTDGWATCIIYSADGTVINHELGGHGFGLLWDEYEEITESFTERIHLDEDYSYYGWGGNVDWRNNPDDVRWSHLLKDHRYDQEGLGVYEGAYLYSYGIYRSTENSVMRHHTLSTGKAFNAPSREQIYKTIMKYSEGDGWVYDYETFVKADAAGREQAAKVFNSASSSAAARLQAQKRLSDYHMPPVIVDGDVKEIGVDKDGNVIIRR